MSKCNIKDDFIITLTVIVSQVSLVVNGCSVMQFCVLFRTSIFCKNGNDIVVVLLLFLFLQCGCLHSLVYLFL